MFVSHSFPGEGEISPSPDLSSCHSNAAAERTAASSRTPGLSLTMLSAKTHTEGPNPITDSNL